MNFSSSSRGRHRILRIAAREVRRAAEHGAVGELDRDARRPGGRILRRQIVGDGHRRAVEQRGDAGVAHAVRRESIRRELRRAPTRPSASAAATQ